MRPRPASAPAPSGSDPRCVSLPSALGERVELPAPATVLADVLLHRAQQRRLAVDLVLPDRDVLADALAEARRGLHCGVLAERLRGREDPADVDIVLVDRRRA